jgi:non-heme chloroperoxidase
VLRSRGCMKTGLRLMLFSAFVSCAHLVAPAAPAVWTEPPGLHQVRFVTVAPGVSLEVVDWGGVGPPVLFVTGLSGTAHVYDGFAPALTDRFHVYGVTRRGWGLSSVPDKGYDMGSLVLDLLRTLDGLKLLRVSLIGHSAGGEELTAFAIAHPERVERLVYLDAAYDRSDPAVQPGGLGDCVNVEPPVEADLASAEAFGAWFSRSRGVQLPTAEVHMLFEHHGPSEEAANEYLKSIVAPDYSRLRAPALAVYAVPASAADFFPGWSRMDESARIKAQTCFEKGQEQAVAKASRADFRARTALGKVVELPHATHYLFLSNRDEVLGCVRAFLLGGP